MIELGFIMLALPFIALFLFICKVDGIKAALIVFGVCGTICGCIAIGCILITSELLI